MCPPSRQHGDPVATAGGVGESFVELTAEILADAVRAREPRLGALFADPGSLPELDDALLTPAMQAILVRFQLERVAEGVERARRRRAVGPDTVPGSFGHVLRELHSLGIDGAGLGAALERLRVSPTLTAHPTEAKRMTALEHLRRVHLTLEEIEECRDAPGRRETLLRTLRNVIEILLVTGERRRERPDPREEVALGLHFFTETLFDAAGAAYAGLARALISHYPEAEIRPPAYLRFYSWSGGDRDGNPNVTADVTHWTLAEHRRAAIGRHRARIRRLARMLSLSERVRPVPDEFRARVEATVAASGDGEALVRRNPDEPFRQMLSAIDLRLQANLGASGVQATPFEGPSALRREIDAVAVALGAMGMERLAADEVQPLVWEIQTFGFRTAALDLRQNVTVVNATVRELMGGDAPEIGSEKWAERLRSGLSDDAQVEPNQVEPDQVEPDMETLSDGARDMMDLFRLISGERDDPEAIGAFVLSMTHAAEDLLGLFWLGRQLCGWGPGEGPPIVPLIETIDDLGRAGATLDRFFSIDHVRRDIARRGDLLEVMIGYSDTNKDGGFLTALWELAKAQRSVAETCARHGVKVRFFHGRGGSISRGGAPAGRAIAALPAGTVDGQIRLTEQGEVISDKYADREAAEHELELLGASVLAHTLKSPQEARESERTEFFEVMDALSASSMRAYRELIDAEGFFDYFYAATPVNEMALLNIGSRPAKRFGAAGLEDLRAIPWVFAWSQSRHMLTGWYGLGTALDDFLGEQGKEGSAQLDALFERSRLFRLVLGEAEKSLLQADMEIAGLYAGLVEDAEVRKRLLGRVREEFGLTRDRILGITGSARPAERFPAFRRRMERRRGMIERCNRWQVDLLRRWRGLEKESSERDRLRAPLALSMNCVAEGLGWVG